jgi:CheY-like chemotaxis protein
MVRLFASRVLRQAGYQVLEVGDGESAPQLAQPRGNIALLVTDVVMQPRGSTARAARRFGEQRPGVPALQPTSRTADRRRAHLQ